jgi:hypothetical protein
MTTTEIRDLALQLPPEERALLARELLASMESGASASRPLGASEEAIEQIVAITCQLFQSPVTVKESYDPEFPDEKYTVFVAESGADHATVLNLENQWNRRVTRLVPGWHGFRLSVRRKK